jgi:hypothetical protein
VTNDESYRQIRCCENKQQTITLKENIKMKLNRQDTEVTIIYQTVALDDKMIKEG